MAVPVKLTNKLNLPSSIVEAVRLNAYRPRSFPLNTLLEMVMPVDGLVASVEEKPMPLPVPLPSCWPTNELLSMRTSDRVPPATNWSV